MGGYARCYNCGYTVAKDEDTLCDVCQSPSDNNYTEPLIAERDRLAAENAELRKQSDEDMEAFLDMARISEDYAAQLTQVQSELAAANATLDALREICGPNKTISNSTCMKMVDILYPQPKETGDADE